MVDLSRRAANLPEQMDDPQCDSARLWNTYRQFAEINRRVSGWRSIYRQILRPAWKASSAPSVLDIGFGGGDILRALHRWCAVDGISLQVTGIDPEPRALAFAAEAGGPPGATLRCARASDLVRARARFDVVISNNVLHHLEPDALRAFLADSGRLAVRVAAHNDLRRSRAAWFLFQIWAKDHFLHSFTVPDGLVSLRRSYTAPELAELAPPGWEIRARFPFRLLAMVRK